MSFNKFHIVKAPTGIHPFVLDDSVYNAIHAQSLVRLYGSPIYLLSISSRAFRLYCCKISTAIWDFTLILNGFS